MHMHANTIDQITDPLAGWYLHRFAGVNLPEPCLIEHSRQVEYGFELTVWINDEMITLTLNPQTRVLVVK